MTELETALLFLFFFSSHNFVHFTPYTTRKQQWFLAFTASTNNSGAEIERTSTNLMHRTCNFPPGTHRHYKCWKVWKPARRVQPVGKVAYFYVGPSCTLVKVKLPLMFLSFHEKASMCVCGKGGEGRGVCGPENMKTSN